jgi:hypothetical protein
MLFLKVLLLTCEWWWSNGELGRHFAVMDKLKMVRKFN